MKTIYLTLDIFTFILTGNPSAVRVADDFKTWVGNIAASVALQHLPSAYFSTKAGEGGV